MNRDSGRELPWKLWGTDLRFCGILVEEPKSRLQLFCWTGYRAT